MADDTRSDAMKATNASLTPPGQDGADRGRDYPGNDQGRQRVEVGDVATPSAPTYGAGPGAEIDRDADPAAPTGGPLARTTADRNNPDTGGTTRPHSDARADGGQEDIVPGQATPQVDNAQSQATSPQVQSEPKSPMPPQHQGKPGLEYEMNPRPQYVAPLYKAAGKLNGKVALITGGDSGIGRAVAVLYAKEGADVAIVFLPAELTDAQETQRAVEHEGRRCILLPGDLTDAAFCRTCVETTVAQLGKLDILVSNAAWQNRKDSLEEITDEEFDLTFKTNVYAYFHLARAAVRHMKPGSAIIATGSQAGLDGSKALIDYSATKGAIHLFSKSLAQNLADKGIRVNVVAPGPVWTPLNVADQGMTPEKVAKFGSDTPLKRPAQPEEIAPAYVFLASDADSSFVNGIVLREMGGTTSAG